MPPTGCHRDSACRLRHGGGMVVWGWYSQVRASSELQFGALRKVGGTRESGGTVAESLVMLYRVGTHQIRRRRRAARSIVDEPGEGWTPVRENHRLKPGGFWGKSWCLTTVLFLPTRATRSGERARFVGLFQGCTGLWTAGCWLARRLHQLKASTAMDLGISISLFFYSVWPWEARICWSKLVGA